MTPRHAVRHFHRLFLVPAMAAAAVALLASGPGFAQGIDENLWITNGTVNTVVRDGGTVYVGGVFSEVGPATGGGVPIDAVTGLLPPSFPKVAGTVNVVIPDGSGGWYVGGAFSGVGGLPRSNVARVKADLSVSSWNPNANGTVYALALGGSRVYAGGQFTSMGGLTRRRVAALDTLSGAVTSWNPNAAGRVWALVVVDTVVYAGGEFDSIGGQTRGRIAGLGMVSGVATSWNPGANGTVRALAASDSGICAGGDFTSIGGQTRSRIGAVRYADGTATTWNPAANSFVYALAVSGSTVYAGGLFTTIGGQSRDRIAALDAVTGLASAWNPAASGFVYAVRRSGSTVYAGGAFTSIGGQTRHYLAALDATTGLATAWDPRPSSTVFALSASGSTVYAGGGFGSLGGIVRNNIAAFDAATGAATAWNPNASDTVHTVAVSGSTVYAGGSFTVIGGQSRNRIAALDVVTGAALAWNPGANDAVNALLVKGTTVYAGGSFGTIGGQARSTIAAIDADSLSAGYGLATPWNPIGNATVRALASIDSIIVAGGDFTFMGGQARSFIAALDVASGSATAWNPSANDAVHALAVDGLVYAGGSFSSIGGQTRNGIAALQRATGAATSWNPNASASVYALATDGPIVYAGGDFIGIGGQTRRRLAALSATTGLATAWNPNPDGTVAALAVGGLDVYAGGSFIDIGGLRQPRIAAIAAVPVLLAVDPASGGNAGVATVTLSGRNLRAGATTTLSRAGQANISGTGVVAAADGLTLSATFDLAGAATGRWAVNLQNPDLQVAGLAPDSFFVELPAPYEIRVNVLGPTQIRPNRRRAFDVVLENLGNSDVLNVPLWISRIPANATVELDFPLTPPPQIGGEPDWSEAPLTLDGPGGKYLAVVIPRLPPGTSVRRLYLTVPNPVTSFELDAALTPPWVNGNVFLDCLSGGGVIAAPACVGARLDVINAFLPTAPGVQALSGIGLWAKIAWQCEGAASLAAALVKAEQVLDFMLQPVEGTSVPSDCEVALVPRWQDRRPVTIVTSVDPNDKLGAGGVGASRLIGSEQLLPYSIRFENLETAMAPAQEVLVVDALDVATLDVNTVSLGPITFGDRVIYPPPGLAQYTTDVDLRPARELIVRVGVNLDVATGVLRWSLNAIHPTGRPLEDDEGFLPANVTPPAGEGSVLFTVMPKPGLAGGTAIRNSATIDFDGVPRLTPEWANTLDTTAPESEVVLPGTATTDSASFTVSWAAQGTPPDLRDFSVYVSEDGGPYRPWRAHTTATADTIGAPGGRTYSFYSLARDLSGNLEAVPATPDVQTFSRVAVDERVPLRLALEGAAPNPTMGAARVWFTLPSREGATLEVVDVAGRRVFKRDVGSLGPGRHAVDVSAAARRPGLYFLRLAQGGRTLNARMVVVR